MVKAFVVDDNRLNQKVSTRLLEKIGCSCDVASNGLDAVEAVTQVTYDIVFMACHMPELDGYEATRIIRERESAGTHLPIIALTADAVKGVRHACQRAGMDDCMTKPVSRESLAAMVHKYTTR